MNQIRKAAPATAREQHGGTAAASPDAELIAACNRYLEIEDYFEARYGHEDIDGDDPALWEQPEILEKAVTLRASTPHGHVARAKLIACYLPLLLIIEESKDTEDNLVAALLRDLIGEAEMANIGKEPGR